MVHVNGAVDSKPHGPSTTPPSGKTSPPKRSKKPSGSPKTWPPATASATPDCS